MDEPAHLVLRRGEEPGRHDHDVALSGGAPGQLMRRGIRKDQLVVGAVVNVDGFRAKDGSHNGFGRSVTDQDGRNVFTASAADKCGTN